VTFSYKTDHSIILQFQ